MIGLQLYKRPFIDFILESSVVLGGWLIYRQSLPSERRSAEPMFTLLGALLVVQIGADIFLSFAKGLRKC